MAAAPPIVGVRFIEQPVRASLGLLALASGIGALLYMPVWAHSGPMMVLYSLAQGGLPLAALALLFRRNRHA